jgi:hypothetical protein
MAWESRGRIQGVGQMSEPDYVRAHKNSFRNRDEIHRSSICGCFYCLATYPPAEVIDWVDQKGGTSPTALCPKCGIDSVIGSASGFPITVEFLKKMNQHYF